MTDLCSRCRATHCRLFRSIDPRDGDALLCAACAEATEGCVATSSLAIGAWLPAVRKDAESFYAVVRATPGGEWSFVDGADATWDAYVRWRQQALYPMPRRPLSRDLRFALEALRNAARSVVPSTRFAERLATLTQQTEILIVDVDSDTVAPSERRQIP